MCCSVVVPLRSRFKPSALLPAQPGDKHIKPAPTKSGTQLSVFIDFLQSHLLAACLATVMYCDYQLRRLTLCGVPAEGASHAAVRRCAVTHSLTWVIARLRVIVPISVKILLHYLTKRKFARTARTSSDFYRSIAFLAPHRSIRLPKAAKNFWVSYCYSSLSQKRGVAVRETENRLWPTASDFVKQITCSLAKRRFVSAPIRC